MAFKLQFRFGLYRPGQGPPDFALGDEIWILNDEWDGRSRGAIVFDVDFLVIGGDPGVVRAMSPHGVVFGASRRTHRVIRKATDPEPPLFCECDHPQTSHFCWDCGNYNHKGRFDIHENHGPCNYPNCQCTKLRPVEPSVFFFEE